ncbi:MFS general substrate transporter [Lepidopterella palustris CBS 459.81]|uniref:MFS general substrate transporter n=1 Tax=Lepidopterella palustris CBS 459.81 TaxID=1314670 RepID=A0A8E2DXT4_9PEZI|nr:MFS general substrate transporter [Lepidopterella palustris CBS 459.81]
MGTENRASGEDENKPEEFPVDRGGTAWLQVAVGFLAIMNCFGFFSAFGLIISGRLVDAGYFYPVMIGGCALQLIGIFGASFATKYWSIFLTQGIVLGLGSGLMWAPAMWLIATHFDRKKGLAIGISSTGSPIGAIVFTAAGLRVMRAFFLVGNSILLAASSPRPPPEHNRRAPLVEWQAFKQLDYSLFCAGTFISALAVWSVVYYIPAFGEMVLSLPPTTSVTTLIIMNSSGLLGRILVLWLSDHFYGPLPNLTICTLLCASCIFFWLYIINLTGLFIWAGFYGFFWHAIQTLFTASCAGITRDREKLGARMGMCFSLISLSVLIGALMGGALVQADGGGYLYAQVMAGCAYVVGVAMVGSAWLVQEKSSSRRGRERGRLKIF